MKMRKIHLRKKKMETFDEDDEKLRKMKSLPVPHQRTGHTVESCKVAFHKVLKINGDR